MSNVFQVAHVKNELRLLFVYSRMKRFNHKFRLVDVNVVDGYRCYCCCYSCCCCCMFVVNTNYLKFQNISSRLDLKKFLKSAFICLPLKNIMHNDYNTISWRKILATFRRDKKRDKKCFRGATTQSFEVFLLL